MTRGARRGILVATREGSGATATELPREAERSDEEAEQVAGAGKEHLHEVQGEQKTEEEARWHCGGLLVELRRFSEAAAATASCG